MSTGYVFSGPVQSFNASEVERQDAEVVEATLMWQGDVLETKHFAIGQAITIGEVDGTDFTVPLASLGSEWAEIVGASTMTMVQAPAGASMLVDGQLRDAREPLDLRTGHACTMNVGEFAIDLRVVPAGRETPAGILESIKDSALGSITASAMVHTAIFASLAMFLPALGNDDAEAISRDQMYAMQHYLDSAAEREREREMTPAPENSDSASGAAGGQTAGESGKIGISQPKSLGHISVAGNEKEISLPREKQLQIAREFGMNQLVGALASQLDNGNAIPWGDVQSGANRETHIGDLWSPDIGDASGFGWGLSGTGEGGGCNGGPCTGIGINGIAGLGVGIGQCADPPCTGFDHGNGHGHLQPGYVPKQHGLRFAKDIDVNGHIPAEVIQRIVRQNAGRYRACYEAGLRTNPSLSGRVAVKFIIGRDGAVSLAGDSGGSDIPDNSVRDCVVKSFYNLSFPQPQGGTVRVTYPLMFSPSE